MRLSGLGFVRVSQTGVLFSFRGDTSQSEGVCSSRQLHGCIRGVPRPEKKNKPQSDSETTCAT